MQHGTGTASNRDSVIADVLGFEDSPDVESPLGACLEQEAEGSTGEGDRDSLPHSFEDVEERDVVIVHDAFENAGVLAGVVLVVLPLGDELLQDSRSRGVLVFDN